MAEEKKLPREWCKELCITVVDPDGWNEAGRTWFEPVTKDEFDKMVSTSTVEIRRRRGGRVKATSPKPSESESPDTLVLELGPDSLNYVIGDTVWTHNADYRVEQITEDGRGQRHVFLLRLDLTKRPIVNFEDE